MRVARWRWVLVPMAIVVAGCLPKPPAPVLPASFVEHVRLEGQVFTPLEPGGMTAGDAVVAALRARGRPPSVQHMAVPIFGKLSCLVCSGPAGLGVPDHEVWVVVYPDWTGPDGDVAWVVLDAVAALDEGGFLFAHDARP